jgi:hypothetical protein
MSKKEDTIVVHVNNLYHIQEISKKVYVSSHFVPLILVGQINETRSFDLS